MQRKSASTASNAGRRLNLQAQWAVKTRLTQVIHALILDARPRPVGDNHGDIKQGPVPAGQRLTDAAWHCIHVDHLVSDTACQLHGTAAVVVDV